MNDLTETEKAYIAGFMDGEGCISISKYQGKTNRTPVYTLNVVIGQKGLDVLQTLYEITDIGSIHEHKKSLYPGPFYQWRINPRDAVELLTAILPYLLGKKQEAEIAIEYQSQQGHSHSMGKGWTVPQNMIDDKEQYYRKLQKIKGTSGKNGNRDKPKI